MEYGYHHTLASCEAGGGALGGGGLLSVGLGRLRSVQMPKHSLLFTARRLTVSKISRHLPRPVHANGVTHVRHTLHAFALVSYF